MIVNEHGEAARCVFYYTAKYKHWITEQNTAAALFHQVRLSLSESSLSRHHLSHRRMYSPRNTEKILNQPFSSVIALYHIGPDFKSLSSSRSRHLSKSCRKGHGEKENKIPHVIKRGETMNEISLRVRVLYC